MHVSFGLQLPLPQLGRHGPQSAWQVTPSSAFCFRSRLAKGTWLFVVSLAAVIVCGTILVRWLSFPWNLDGITEIVGASVTVMEAVAFEAALGWLSLRLSVHFCDRRDL